MKDKHLMSDSFAVALMLALTLHAAVLLVLSFTFDISPLRKAVETLDVVLVNWRSEKAPEVADFLAQASQIGGGESTEATRPSRSLSGTAPGESEGGMPGPVDSQLQAEKMDVLQEVISEDESARPIQQITLVEQPEEDLPSAADLMQQSLQIAQLNPALQREHEWKSRLPRRRFISANTREYEFASYMHAWVAKVERVGNINYPMEILRRKLTGTLLLTVGINQDGSVESIEVRRGSGIPELNDAAIRIVRLAAPYSPLPENISSKVDVLHITRTWKFTSGYRFE